MPYVDGLIVGASLALLFGVLFWILLGPEKRPAPIQAPAPERTQPRKAKARTGAEAKKAIETFPLVRVLDICDGDTVYIETGWSQIKVRLDSIDCPENGQRWGDTATYGLIKLIGGRRTVRMEEHGIDDFGRTLATLYVLHGNGDDWINVNERMVTLGHAWVMRRYYDHLPPDRQDKLNKLEAWAKSKNVGLWSTADPIPPWRWRKEVWRPPAH